MVIRVPLVLEVTDVVIHRLNTVATKAVDPYTGANTGFDDAFREPRVFDDTSGGSSTSAPQRTESTLYSAPIIVPCQVEITNFERLQELFQGDVPDTVLTLVASRIDLERLDLIDTTTGRPKFNVNDKITHFEKNGRTVRTFVDPLYVQQVQPASYGFGPDGQDLELLFVADREKAGR